MRRNWKREEREIITSIKMTTHKKRRDSSSQRVRDFSCLITGKSDATATAYMIICFLFLFFDSFRFRCGFAPTLYETRKWICYSLLYKWWRYFRSLFVGECENVEYYKKFRNLKSECTIHVLYKQKRLLFEHWVIEASRYVECKYNAIYFDQNQLEDRLCVCYI